MKRASNLMRSMLNVVFLCICVFGIKLKILVQLNETAAVELKIEH